MRIFFILLFLVGCGVKGDPVPPEEPAHIGRGKPNFKKAVERFDIRTEEMAGEKEDEDDKEEEE